MSNHRLLTRARWLGAALVVMALLSGVAACGSDGTQDHAPNQGKRRSTTNDTSPESYVGLTKSAAIAKAEAEDRVWRILREDDEQFMATLDYSETRINFEIDNAKVTKATYG